MYSHLTIPVLLALSSLSPRADAQTATITEVSDTVSRGVIMVDAPPSEVYALITDYAAWRTFLTDVVSLQVLEGGRHRAKIRLKTRSLGREATVEFDNVPDRALRFRLIDGPPGARLRGEYLLVPIDGGTRTRAEATLYMDVTGLAALFVSDTQLRAMRRAKLQTDLEDVARQMRRMRQRPS